MGVKIECAQCHNHPFAPYKKEQFWALAAFFAEIQPAIANLSDPKFKREIKIPDISKTVQARFFNDTHEPAWDAKKSPRETFADWLTAKDNPYFARNMVNRTWAHFLGLGLVEPIDEPSEDNPPAIPEVLDELSRIYTDERLRHAASSFGSSRGAGRISSPASKRMPATPEQKRFARVSVKSMTGEQLFDSLAMATGYFDGTSMRDRQFFGIRREFVAKFGSTEKLTEKQTSILQALTLMNGNFVNEQTSLDRSQILAGVIDAPFLDTPGRIEAMYLAALSRKPTQPEVQKFASYVDRGGTTGDKKKAVTDVFWALLNSSEFVLNH